MQPSLAIIFIILFLCCLQLGGPVVPETSRRIIT